MSYHPTIWRTCRVLANERRLRCLEVVLRQPGLSVGEIAKQVAIPENQASLCLRALQARGLLSARRRSRWVHYFPSPDPLVPAAAHILAVVSQAILTAKWSADRIIHHLTAYTHPRRLTVLPCLLMKDSLTTPVLARETHISWQALTRHLNKLSERKMIVDNDAAWSLHPDRDFFSETFLQLIAQHADLWVRNTMN